MLQLNYIIIGDLPEQETRFIRENLKGQENDYRMVWLNRTVSFSEGQEAISPQEPPDWLKQMSRCPGEESILVSQDASQLAEGMRLNMAVAAYLPQPAFQNAEETESTRCKREMPEEEMLQADIYIEGMEEIDITFLLHVYERRHHLPWTILETKRCIIREFSMQDLDALFELYSGEGMTDYMEPLYEYEEEKTYQEAYIEYMYRFYGYGMWLVFEKESGRLIGRAGIEHRDELGDELELGYAIAVSDQGKGYATEVCKAILSYVQEYLCRPSVCCLIEVENAVSEHIAKKLGFVYKENLLLDGKNMMKYILIF